MLYPTPLCFTLLHYALPYYHYVHTILYPTSISNILPSFHMWTPTPNPTPLPYFLLYIHTIPTPKQHLIMPPTPLPPPTTCQSISWTNASIRWLSPERKSERIIAPKDLHKSGSRDGQNIWNIFKVHNDESGCSLGLVWRVQYCKTNDLKVV